MRSSRVIITPLTVVSVLVLTTIIALRFVSDLDTEHYFDPSMLTVISLAYLFAWAAVIRANWGAWSILSVGLACTLLGDAMLYWYIQWGSPLRLDLDIWTAIIRSLLFVGGPTLLLGLIQETWNWPRVTPAQDRRENLQNIREEEQNDRETQQGERDVSQQARGAGQDTRDHEQAARDVRQDDQHGKTGIVDMVAVLATALPVTVADTSGRIVSATAAMDAMAGYGPGELAGRNLVDLMPPKWVPHHRAGLSRYLRTGESQILGKIVPVELLRKDGTVIPVSLAVTVGEHDGERWLIGGMWEREPDEQ